LDPTHPDRVDRTAKRLAPAMMYDASLFRFKPPKPKSNKPPTVVTEIPAVLTVNAVEAVPVVALPELVAFAFEMLEPEFATTTEAFENPHELLYGVPSHDNVTVPANPFRPVIEIAPEDDPPLTIVMLVGRLSEKSGGGSTI